jgi:hypothetical protein
MTNILLLLLLLIVFWKLKYFTVESFLPIPSNAFDIPKDSTNNLTDSIQQVKDIFTKYNTISFSDIPLSQFTETPYYTDKNDTDNLNGLIKESMIDILNKIGIKGKLDLVRDIYNIKWRSVSSIKEFVFNVDLINPSEFYVIPLFMYISVDLKGRDPNSFKLLFLDTEQNSKSTEFSIKPYENDSFYRIKNHLYLFDPYLTSGKEMEINTN